MAKQVDVNKTLLDVYNDKELVNYLAKRLRKALQWGDTDKFSVEVQAVSMVDEIYVDVLPLLEAVNRRMNGDSNEPNIVV